jgi:hypothetical protein
MFGNKIRTAFAAAVCLRGAVEIDKHLQIDGCKNHQVYRAGSIPSERRKVPASLEACLTCAETLFS